MRICAACSKPIPLGESNLYRPTIWVCSDCVPIANPICTTRRGCSCAPKGSEECCCIGAPNGRVLHFSPDDGRAMTCRECLAPIVFINVNTGKKLAA